MLRTAAALLLLAAPPLAAQQATLMAPLPSDAAPAPTHPLAGTWKFNFPMGTGVKNGVSSPLEGTGTLTLQLKGDSLIGNLVRDYPTAPPPGVALPPPTRFAAKADTGSITFVTEGRMAMVRDGAMQAAPVTTTWKLLARGDSLSGTVTRTVEGMAEAGHAALAVSGLRSKKA